MFVKSFKQTSFVGTDKRGPMEVKVLDWLVKHNRFGNLLAIHVNLLADFTIRDQLLTRTSEH